MKKLWPHISYVYNVIQSVNAYVHVGKRERKKRKKVRKKERVNH